MVYRRGRTWWYEFVFHGQRIRESSGCTSKTAAREVERRRRQDLIDSLKGISVPRTPVLFRVAAEEWKAAKSPGWSEANLRIETANLGHLMPTFGGMLLIDISAADIGNYQTGRLDVGAASSLINREVGTLRAVLRRYRLWSNVAPDVVRLEERDDVGMALTTDQEDALVAACLASRSRLLHPAVTVAIYTGLRRAELLKLRWGQIDFAARTLKVGAAKTKAGKGRVVPLNQQALAALTAWAEQFP